MRGGVLYVSARQAERQEKKEIPRITYRNKNKKNKGGPPWERVRSARGINLRIVLCVCVYTFFLSFQCGVINVTNDRFFEGGLRQSCCCRTKVKGKKKKFEPTPPLLKMRRCVILSGLEMTEREREGHVGISIFFGNYDVCSCI